MGIKNLTKILKDKAKSSLTERTLSFYHGRVIAIDSYMFLYQFLVAIRAGEGRAFTNESGEETMHLSGLFYRTIRFLEHGIKPVYIFDGQAPEQKSDELAKRATLKEDAAKSLEIAKEEGNIADIEKFSKRVVKITSQHCEDSKRLLDLMGIPYFNAPSEAEAQCAKFQQQGIAYAVASEDMDTLACGSSVLLRNFSASETKKLPIIEINKEKMLEELNITNEQFIDLSILLGCDFTPTIKGIGPKKALDLILKHGSIEAIIETINTDKYKVPDNWNYKEARDLFLNPSVSEEKPDFKWKSPNTEELINFLVDEKGFSDERVRNGIKRIEKNISKPIQSRLDSFFKISKKKTLTDSQTSPSSAKKIKTK